MTALIFAAAAVTAYLVGSINPAIILSRTIYRTDVRGFGSHNPGFTNFMRVFGNHHAWTVFILDFAKSAIVCGGFGWLFLRTFGLFHLGAAYTSVFALLGHVYPVWYGFQGGKGVAVMFAAMWFIEWRAAAVILGVFLILIIATRYMSLSVIFAALTGPITMCVTGVEHPAVMILTCLGIALMILRHHENIQRLLKGTESKFVLKKKDRRE